MTVQEFLVTLKDRPKFFVMYVHDSELRPIYINKFVQAHQGKAIYRETMENSKQPRIIGQKPVYVILDWEPGIKKPNSHYLKTNTPTLLVYTKKGEAPKSVLDAYHNQVVVIPEITGEQATNLLRKQGLDDKLIDYLKEKTENTQEAILLGKQIKSLASDLELSLQDCFNQYYRNWLDGRNLDEEPTEFLNALLFGNQNIVFDYLRNQRGNELFIYASILNWLEDIIRFCSCEGDYWNDAGLVAAKYKVFRSQGVSRKPFFIWIRLYESGLRSMQSIKINEADPSVALEVFICFIIQTLM